jgi:hypothetical protein
MFPELMTSNSLYAYDEILRNQYSLATLSYCTISTVGSSRVAQGLRRTQVEPVVAEDVDERPKNRPKKEILIKNLRPPHQSCFDRASIEPIVARTYVASHIDRTYGRNSTVFVVVYE